MAEETNAIPSSCESFAPKSKTTTSQSSNNLSLTHVSKKEGDYDGWIDTRNSRRTQCGEVGPCGSFSSARVLKALAGIRFTRAGPNMDALLNRSHNFVEGFEADSELSRNLTSNIESGHDFEAAIPRSNTLENLAHSTQSSNSIFEVESSSEDLDSKPLKMHDSLTLRAAEKSFFDFLDQSLAPSTNRHLDNQCSLSGIGNPDGLEFTFSESAGNQELVHSSSEASKIDGESSLSMPAIATQQTTEAAVELEKKRSVDKSRGKKNHRPENGEYLQGRAKKKSASFINDSHPEPPEIYDLVLICHDQDQNQSSLQIPGRKKLPVKRGNGRKGLSKKQEDSRVVVDLQNLLTLCAQAVAIGDQRTARAQLEQIRQTSSASGDGMQRLAHYFANGLETRLAGWTPLYMPLVGSEISSAGIFKAYQTYITACPFKRIEDLFANRAILKLVRKATKLHIIDFGVQYGLQWPCFIQQLSHWPNGPPRLRMTCIELPQPVFRPAERAEQTGHRLDSYCKRLNVPFEYNVIARTWETIKFEDLQVEMDELKVVNCIYGLKNIPDEPVGPYSPRDRVLRLIKKINPDLFLHGVLNATYSSQFFTTHFQEALFHFLPLFEMFDSTVPRDNHGRYMFERDIYGRDVMNVIACEGLKRVERPEMYKKWQVRMRRSGFRSIPLDRVTLEKAKAMIKSDYDQQFFVEVDRNWLVQGWRGRAIYALSCWKPV